MCRATSKAFRLGIMNSPVHAAVKKLVVRQANTAVCSGEVRSKHSLIATMVARVYGSLAGHLDVGGARLHAAL